MPRIISLIASATEIVCALGFEKELVGRSHECDYPESIQKLPVCTEPAFDIEGTSSEIDARVKEKLYSGLSLYQVHADLLHDLAPEVILTQSHCEVCAVSKKDIEKAFGSSASSKIVSLTPNALSDIWVGIRQIAKALDAKEAGEELVWELRSRMSQIAEKSRRLKERKSIACIEWISPLMAAGNWVPELVKMAGGVSLFGEPGKHSPWMSFEDLRAKNPDVILVIPCGWDVSRAKKEMASLTQRADWPLLKAVQNKQVFVADGNQFFNRPGPRVVESLEILAEILYPQIFHFGHQGKSWEILN